jgi:hypothetical protein
LSHVDYLAGVTDIRLLGPVEVRSAGSPVVVGPPMQRNVLAALAVDAGQPVTVATLIDRGVGTERTPAGAGRATHLHRSAAPGADGLVWITASSADAIVTGYAQASAEVPGSDPADAHAGARAFLAHLAATTSQWLIVLDDLTNPPDLDGWWPPRVPTGQVVVTARRRDAALAGRSWPCRRMRGVPGRPPLAAPECQRSTACAASCDSVRGADQADRLCGGTARSMDHPAKAARAW